MNIKDLLNGPDIDLKSRNPLNLLIMTENIVKENDVSIASALSANSVVSDSPFVFSPVWYCLLFI